MLESNLTLREQHTIFGRVEVVGKPAHDLHAHEYGSRVFGVGKLETGYGRQLTTWKSMVIGIGGIVMANLVRRNSRRGTQDASHQDSVCSSRSDRRGRRCERTRQRHRRAESTRRSANQLWCGDWRLRLVERHRMAVSVVD